MLARRRRENARFGGSKEPALVVIVVFLTPTSVENAMFSVLGSSILTFGHFCPNIWRIFIFCHFLFSATKWQKRQKMSDFPNGRICHKMYENKRYAQTAGVPRRMPTVVGPGASPSARWWRSTVPSTMRHHTRF